jgi:hypothetical protein
MVMLAIAAVSATAQDPASPEDAAIDQICKLDQISEGDQNRIAEWVQGQLDRLGQVPEAERLKAANRLRDRFAARFGDKQCTDAFRTQFPIQAASVAEKTLSSPSTGPYVAYAVARVLLDMNRPETGAALIACLKSPLPVARFLCLRGLTEQKQQIAGDKDRLERTRLALREAGMAEQDSIALAQVYRALGYANQASTVFDDYMAIFSRRLDDAKAGGRKVADGAELEAFAFLDTQGVLDALNQNQKQQLVGPLAEFMHLYSTRYNTEKLEFDEVDRLERSLYYTESLMDRLVDKDGGKIRDVLTSQGYTGRASVVAEAAKWIGDVESKTPGAVNGPPWNVPLGGSAQAEASARTPGSTE